MSTTSTASLSPASSARSLASLFEEGEEEEPEVQSCWTRLKERRHLLSAGVGLVGGMAAFATMDSHPEKADRIAKRALAMIPVVSCAFYGLRQLVCSETTSKLYLKAALISGVTGIISLIYVAIAELP